MIIADMKKGNLIQELSYDFALRMIKAYRYLCDKKHEFVLSNQVLRSSTSIGANVKEAIQAESRNDFCHKLKIALKEASETEYWIELLRDSGYIDTKSAASLLEDCQRIIRVLVSIIKSATANNHQSSIINHQSS